MAVMAGIMIWIFAAFVAKPVECFSRESIPLPESALEHAWSNLNLDEIDFKKAGLSEDGMKKTLARVCTEFSAYPQKTRFLVSEIYRYEDFRGLYLSSSKSVRKRVDTLLPKILDNIFRGEKSITQGVSFADKTKGLATYLLNKRKMDAFAKLRYNEKIMRRLAASIYSSLDTDDPELAKSLDALFVTMANKKKYKFDKKTALDHASRSRSFQAQAVETMQRSFFVSGKDAFQRSPEQEAKSHPARKGVEASFIPDGGIRPVAAANAQRISQRKQLLPDTADQGIVITARKIRPANGPGKKRIPHKNHILCRKGNTSG